jgi:hypothetical protein
MRVPLLNIKLEILAVGLHCRQSGQVGAQNRDVARLEP